uniref:Uncharacterized protein n=1 Tax=Rhizophora mucronata TaxID=61149 RepID=A0A2P2Q3B3_RHIMU
MSEIFVFINRWIKEKDHRFRMKNIYSLLFNKAEQTDHQSISTMNGRCQPLPHGCICKWQSPPMSLKL